MEWKDFVFLTDFACCPLQGTSSLPSIPLTLVCGLPKQGLLSTLNKDFPLASSKEKDNFFLF